jgi:glucose/arabinose dehydrogenase
MQEMSRRKKIVVAVIAATVLGIAAVGCAEAPSEESAEAAEATQPKPKPKEQPAPKSVKKQLREEQLENPEEEIEITAEMVVDLTFAEPGQKRLFCSAYRMIGEAGFKQFAQSYGKPVEGAPSAREVFEESASRC